jgi:hypothetical protein
MIDILPDSRAKNPTGLTAGPGGYWVPVFCANCGIEGGKVPEQNMTFIFYQCQKCSDAYGDIAGTMKVPDEVFYQKLADEQYETYGRALSEQELVTIIQEDASPLATLIKGKG